MSRHYILYGHGGSGNHGCEALARTTAEMLDYNNNRITLISYRPEDDKRFGLGQICEVIKRGEHASVLKRTPSFWRAYYYLKVKHNYSVMDDEAELQAMSARKGDCALSIGGDSYCYGEQLRSELIRDHRLLAEKGLKTILWGVSIESELLEDDKLLEDFCTFDLITARESISYKALKAVNPNTILVSDPAFTLKGTKNQFAENLKAGDYGIVGINTSPLIEKSNKDGKIVRENYIKLIETIINRTQYNILLIPHVVQKGNDDLSVLNELYSEFKESKRVEICPDAKCDELKGIIAQCRFFIGARTHSTIAAYSNCIPTLVVGYSTKSRGIARDIFGTEESFVIPAQGLSSETDLADAWEWLEANENQIREKLAASMPEYIQRAYDAKKGVLNL